MWIIIAAALCTTAMGFVAPGGKTTKGTSVITSVSLLEVPSDATSAVSSTENDNDNILESRVIESIKSVASSNGIRNPKKCLSSLAQFATTSGDLITQKWLTPQTLEDCACFWDDGSRALVRDASRFWRGRFPEDIVALGRFALLASGTFPFTPLLLPLIDVALEDVEESGYVPPAFGRVRRRAVRRLRRRGERGLSLDDGTPRNVEEGIRFFGDGTFLLARDLRRGRLLARDTWQSYAWFSFLSFSTFPITPLLLPSIDRRRGEGTSPSDYIPSSYRPTRLRALTRGRTIAASRFGDSVTTLRAVANRNDRPPPASVLDAIVRAQRSGGTDRFSFFDALAGEPNRRWELAYIAGKPAVLNARRRTGADGRASDPWYRPLERVILPWTKLRDGLYVDPFLSAVQNFDGGTMRNKNGVFQILGGDFFETTVDGPFSWSERGGICAFRPDRVGFRIGPFRVDRDVPEDVPFEDTPIRELPFFKFVLVDDAVAVAMGRSGSVALWTRIVE